MSFSRPTRNPPGRRLPVSILSAVLTLPALMAVAGSGGAHAEGRTILDGSSRSSLRLTLYTSQLGLVEETRSLDLDRGIQEVELADVAGGIDPSTLLINGIEGDPFRILEQRVERDPLRPQRLLELYLGREVQLVTRHDGEEQRTPATLLSLDGPVYSVDGRVWIRHPGEIVLPELPPGLRPKPVVIWRIEAEGRGTRKLEAAYLTSDLGWDASYSGRLVEDVLHLQGWATLRNQSSVAFDGAGIRLVAGDVHRVSRPVPMRTAQNRVMMEAAEAAPGFSQEPTFEYHVYTLQRTVRLPEHSSIQVALWEEIALPVTRYLTFRGSPYSLRSPAPESRDLRPEIHLEAENPAGPMPAGILRAYGDEETGLVFLGEDRIGRTPEGGRLRIQLGRAFDVVADRVQTDLRAVASGRYDREVAFRIEVRNHKSQPASVRLEEPVPGDWKLLEASMPTAPGDAGLLRFELEVPAGGTAMVDYRVAIDQG